MFDPWPLPAKRYFPIAEGAWISSPPSEKFRMSVIVLDMNFIRRRQNRQWV
jgi:hypothetical protein